MLVVPILQLGVYHITEPIYMQKNISSPNNSYDLYYLMYSIKNILHYDHIENYADFRHNLESGKRSKLLREHVTD